MREQAYLQQELRRCDEAIVHIDAIRLLDPHFDFAGLRPKKHVTEDEWFRPGEKRR